MGTGVVEERCEYGRCRQESALTYLGKPLCDKHWKQLCDRDEKKEQEERDHAS